MHHAAVELAGCCKWHKVAVDPAGMADINFGEGRLLCDRTTFQKSALGMLFFRDAGYD